MRLKFSLLFVFFVILGCGFHCTKENTIKNSRKIKNKKTKKIPKKKYQFTKFPDIQTKEKRNQKKTEYFFVYNSRLFHDFLNKLKAVQSGKGKRKKVRILHFGDSHIHADILTGELRKRFHTHFGNGGYGFLLSGRISKTYYPAGISIKSSGFKFLNLLHLKYGEKGPYGIAGISGYVYKKKGYVSIKTKEAYDLFKVFFLKYKDGGKLSFNIENKLFTINTKARTNSSLLGKREFYLKKKYKRVKVEAKHGTFLFGYSLENSGYGVIYDTLGINGARISDLAGNIHSEENKEIFFKMYEDLNPDMFVLTYGTNEVDDDPFLPKKFEEDFFDVITALKYLKNKEVLCMIIGPPDRNIKVLGNVENSGDEFDFEWQTPEKLKQIIEIEKRVAMETGCIFFDTFSFMGGENSMDMWVSMKLGFKDHVHLTRKGYKAVADEVFSRILKEYLSF